jgi:hypothetical protein
LCGRLKCGVSLWLSGFFHLSCRLTTVEVDQRLLGDLGLDVALVLGLLELLDGGVVGGDVGVVVLGVVQLHDLAADGWLERAVVVWKVFKSALMPLTVYAQQRLDVQDRSGRVALPRVKVVPPMDARMLGAERTAERRALERKRVAAIVSVCAFV